MQRGRQKSSAGFVCFSKRITRRELVDVNEVIREMIVLLRSEANRYSIRSAPILLLIFSKSRPIAFNCNKY
jgi:hypothetical protein